MRSELFAALISAQKEFPSIQRGRTAKVPTKSGGSYSYSYADLSDVVAAVTPILHKHGLCVSQLGGLVDGKQVLTTTLYHAESGTGIDSHFILPFSDDPQDTGGCITYFRRYALCGILGIVTEDDGDAQGKKPASKPEPQKSTKDVEPSGDSGQSPIPAGDFIVPFGSGTSGKRLRELNEQEISGLVKFYAGVPDPKGKAKELKGPFDLFMRGRPTKAASQK